MSILTDSTDGGIGDQKTEAMANETAHPVSTTGGDEGLSLDVVFGLLSNQRRRQTLHYLYENEGLAEISELAEYIAALENDKPVEAVDSNERKRVYVGLYQSHLPKMDDANVVSFDRDRGTIAWSEKADVLHDYLAERERRTSWPLYYLGLSVAGVLTVGVSVALYGVDLQSLLTAGLVLALLTIALVHVFVELYR